MQNRQEVNDITTTTPSTHAISISPIEEQAKPTPLITLRTKFSNLAKKALIYGVAGLNALTPAINSLANILKTPLSKLGFNVIKSAPGTQLALGGASFISAFTINSLTNSFFLPTAIDKLSKGLKKLTKSPTDFLVTIAAIVLALSGGIASGAIAFESFAFLGLPAAILSGAVTLLVVFASRYIGIQNLFNKFALLFNKNAKTQEAFVDHLEHLDLKDNLLAEEVRAVIRHTIDKMKPSDSSTPPTLQSLCENDPLQQERLLRKLAKRLGSLSSDHPELIKEKTYWETFSTVLKASFDLSFAAFMGFGGATVFLQKGYDGVNTLSHFLSSHGLENLPSGVKLVIGLPAGIASSFTYASNAYEFRSTLVKLGSHLIDHPKDIPLALGLTGCNLLASSGPKNVAEGVVNNPNNVMHITSPSAKTAVVVLGTLGATTGLNMKNSITQVFFKKEAPKEPLVKLDLAHPEDEFLKEVITFAKDTSSFVIDDKKTLKKLLTANSLFSQKEAWPLPQLSEELVNENTLLLGNK